MATIAQADPLPRIDGLPKISGSARYAADILRPGTLYARVLRSPLPHARILHVETSAARALAGVHAVLTGADLPDCRVGRSMRDMPVLAGEKVRFIGEKVAAVAAESIEVAEEALSVIQIQYEELPAVFDPVQAMRADAPLIHDPALVRAWKTATQTVADYPNSIGSPVWGASIEEVDKALAGCAHVFEHTFRTPVQHQGYLEPHACTVEIDDAGVAHVWASNKAPFLLLDYLRLGLGLTREQVEVHMLPLGGDFGGKGSFMDVPLAYFLAKATGHPVRMVMSYTEELMAANPRHSAVVTVRSGFSKEGRLQARWTRAIYNSGAYAAFKPSPNATLPGIEGGSRGAYEVPTWRVEGHMVYTNTVPCGHMRAPGEAQTMHAVECHMDLCARAMGIDPLELRLINAPTHPRETPSGEPGSPPRPREVLRAAAAAIGWGAPRPDNVGRGISLVEVGNSLGEYMAAITVGRNGDIVFHTPIIENGAGALSAFRSIIAAELGVSPEQVQVEQTTDGIEYDRGVGGSRITRVIGKVISLLSERLRARLAELLAGEYGFEAGQISPARGGFHTPDGRFHSLAQAASLSPDEVSEALRYKPTRFDSVEVFCAIAAEVSLDRETGQVRVQRVVNAHEIGQIISPMAHQGQIDGGLVQGLGYAMTEGLTFDGGRVTNLNLGEYKLPVTRDVPHLATIFLQPDPSLGITPIGEGPNCAMSAAIVNAIVDVVGRQVQIPVKAEEILDLLTTPSRAR